MDDNSLKYVRCKKCNKLLKTKEAKLRGYGGRCWREYKLDLLKQSDKLVDIKRS